MARKTIPLDLTESQRSELFVLARKPTTPQRLVRRCQIILHRANGLSQQESGERVGISRPMVIEWERRFRSHGLAGLQEAKRSGRKPSISPQLRAEILHEATRPPKGRQRWSTRTMANFDGGTAGGLGFAKGEISLLETAERNLASKKHKKRIKNSY